MFPAPAAAPAAMYGAGPSGWVPKQKSVAVILAVFLSFWTWCYTYKANSAKFWTGLLLCIFGGLLSILILPLLVIPIVWLWAIIDAATAPQSFYDTGAR